MAMPWEYFCLDFCFGTAIDIESLQNRLLKVCYVPATSTKFSKLLFYGGGGGGGGGWPLTVPMEQTRQAVRAFKQSILLRCLWVQHYFYSGHRHNYFLQSGQAVQASAQSIFTTFVFDSSNL
jgi:hypothetical protein